MLHNQILPNKKTKKKLPLILISFGLFALFCIVSVFGYYGYIFSDFKIDASPDHFGQFGDFIGGTLNPILAFLSFMALLYTIKIQTDELKLSREELEATREELKGSRIAQQEQSESLKLQNEATRLQIFENTFFQLIDLFNKEKEKLFKNNININSYVDFISFKMNFNEVKISKSIFPNSNNLQIIRATTAYLYILKSYDGNYNNFNIKYESETGSYFGQLYQIMKFINESKIKNRQRYINIFRAQFTKEELEFLFYHCLGSIGKRKFKRLVEDYAFFEHIILNENIEKQLLDYDKKAFGENENILKRYDELKTK